MRPPTDSLSGNLCFKDVRRRFDRAAETFDDADFVHRTCFAGLLERLMPVMLAPNWVLDLGAASGTGSRQLAKTFRKSRVVSFDASAAMLKRAKRNRTWLAKVTELQADALRIPIQTGSVDLVFANLLLPWVNDLPACLGEIARVLKKGGLFAFSTLGPDSFAEIREAWQADDDKHVNFFPDMHDVGDALLGSGLADPIVDIDRLTVTYADTEALFRDLTACGARNSLQDRRKTLTGKRRFRGMADQLSRATQQQQLSLQLELVYGHAWGNGPRQDGGEFFFAPDEIKRRVRR